MRTYYIFSINKEMSILTKDSPYMLFKSFESIFKANKSDLYVATCLYEQLSSRFNKVLINNKIVSSFKNDQNYNYTKDHHSYYNKYLDESCDLFVKNSYLICTCSSTRMKFLPILSGLSLFVCDFENKDYFWLDEVYC